MRCGISTACLYPEETETALRQLLSDGHKRFEIFFNTVREFHSPYLDRMKDALEEHGATVRSVHPFTCGYESVMLFSNYESRFEDSLEFYREYCEAARKLGADLLILHGMYTDFSSAEAEKRYFRRYRELYRMGQSCGVTVTQENVTRFVAEDPAFVARMREELHDECAFCFDVKQAVRSRVDIREMLRAMGEKLIHVHLNDNSPEKSCLLPGRGTMDFPALFRELKAMGYDGDIIIEVYRSDFWCWTC